MPYMCHVHNGLYVSDEEVEGCQHEYCLQLKNTEVEPILMFGAVPGGTTPASMLKAKSRKFDKDMHVYREAVRGGLDPEQITTEAVEKADKIANGAINEYDTF